MPEEVPWSGKPAPKKPTAVVVQTQGSSLFQPLQHPRRGTLGRDGAGSKSENGIQLSADAGDIENIANIVGFPGTSVGIPGVIPAVNPGLEPFGVIGVNHSGEPLSIGKLVAQAQFEAGQDENDLFPDPKSDTIDGPIFPLNTDGTLAVLNPALNPEGFNPEGFPGEVDGGIEGSESSASSRPCSSRRHEESASSSEERQPSRAVSKNFGPSPKEICTSFGPSPKEISSSQESSVRSGSKESSVRVASKGSEVPRTMCQHPSKEFPSRSISANSGHHPESEVPQNEVATNNSANDDEDALHKGLQRTATEHEFFSQVADKNISEIPTEAAMQIHFPAPPTDSADVKSAFASECHDTQSVDQLKEGAIKSQQLWERPEQDSGRSLSIPEKTKKDRLDKSPLSGTEIDAKTLSGAPVEEIGYRRFYERHTTVYFVVIVCLLVLAGNLFFGWANLASSLKSHRHLDFVCIGLEEGRPTSENDLNSMKNAASPSTLSASSGSSGDSSSGDGTMFTPCDKAKELLLSELVACGFASLLIALFCVGRYLDRFGPRRTTLWGIILCCISMSIFGLAQCAHPHRGRQFTLSGQEVFQDKETGSLSISEDIRAVPADFGYVKILLQLGAGLQAVSIHFVYLSAFKAMVVSKPSESKTALANGAADASAVVHCILSLAARALAVAFPDFFEFGKLEEVTDPHSNAAINAGTLKATVSTTIVHPNWPQREDIIHLHRTPLDSPYAITLCGFSAFLFCFFFPIVLYMYPSLDEFLDHVRLAALIAAEDKNQESKTEHKGVVWNNRNNSYASKVGLGDGTNALDEVSTGTPASGLSRPQPGAKLVAYGKKIHPREVYPQGIELAEWRGTSIGTISLPSLPTIATTENTWDPGNNWKHPAQPPDVQEPWTPGQAWTQVATGERWTPRQSWRPEEEQRRSEEQRRGELHWGEERRPSSTAESAASFRPPSTMMPPAPETLSTTGWSSGVVSGHTGTWTGSAEAGWSSSTSVSHGNFDKTELWKESWKEKEPSWKDPTNPHFKDWKSNVAKERNIKDRKFHEEHDGSPTRARKGSFKGGNSNTSIKNLPKRMRDFDEFSGYTSEGSKSLRKVPSQEFVQFQLHQPSNEGIVNGGLVGGASGSGIMGTGRGSGGLGSGITSPGAPSSVSNPTQGAVVLGMLSGDAGANNMLNSNNSWANNNNSWKQHELQGNNTNNSNNSYSSSWWNNSNSKNGANDAKSGNSSDTEGQAPGQAPVPDVKIVTLVSEQGKVMCISDNSPGSSVWNDNAVGMTATVTGDSHTYVVEDVISYNAAANANGTNDATASYAGNVNNTSGWGNPSLPVASPSWSSGTTDGSNSDLLPNNSRANSAASTQASLTKNLDTQSDPISNVTVSQIGTPQGTNSAGNPATGSKLAIVEDPNGPGNTGTVENTRANCNSLFLKQNANLRRRVQSCLSTRELLMYSIHFRFYVLFCGAQAVNLNWLIATMDVQLVEKGQTPDMDGRYTKMFGVIFAGGCIASPFVGTYMIDKNVNQNDPSKNSYVVPVLASIFFSAGASILTTVLPLQLTPIAFVFVSLTRTVLFALWISYLLAEFGVKNFGTNYSATSIMPNILTLISQYPMMKLALSSSAGFVICNGFKLCGVLISCVFPIYVKVRNL